MSIFLMFLFGIGLLFTVYLLYWWRQGRRVLALREIQRRKQEELQLAFSPAWQAKIAADRAYQLDLAKLELERARFDHQVQTDLAKLWMEKHYVQAERYIVNAQIESITALPSLKAAGSVRAEEVTIQAPLALPDKVLMRDVMRKWDLTPDNLFLALGKGQQEIACTLEDLMHVAHDAPTGGGKTAQFYAEIIMLLKLGVRVILANPHFAPLGKKGEDWRPIGKVIEAQGMIDLAPGVSIPGLIRNYATIANMLQWLATTEIDRRFTMQAVGDYSYKPIYIFVDEWPAVVRRHPEASEYQVDVLQRGRAVEVCIDTNSQGFLSEDVALKGSARENFNTAFHMGGSVYSGSKLLDMPIKDMNALLKNEQVALGKGIALLRNNAAVPQAQLVRLPYAENDYCYYMLGHADGWQLPEFRGKKSVPDNGNISEAIRNAEERLAETVYQDTLSVPDSLAAKRANIPTQEREQIIRLAKIGVSRRDMCAALGKGKYYYETVKQVLDEEGL